MFDFGKIIDKQAFFTYVNSKGKVGKYQVVNASVTDYYLQGIILPERQFRTFKLDRVLAMFTSVDALAAVDLPESAPVVNVARSPFFPKAEICFTGFTIAQRRHLEQLAAAADLSVKKDVTKNLAYLCSGPNVGPVKLRKALDARAVVLTEGQFIDLIETGELPEQGEYELLPAGDQPPSNDIEVINDTFSTWRTLPRRQCLIARFVDEYAVGWRFAVHQAHRDALDIRYTQISTEVKTADGGSRRHTRSVWTQGHAFNFIGGELITSYRGPWFEFMQRPDERVISIKYATPAGYDTVDTLEGEFSGVLRRNNASSEKGERRQEKVPMMVRSQAYDEGSVVFDVSRPSPDEKRLVLVERKTLTQVEMVALLQHGHVTRLITKANGETDIEHYSPFETALSPVLA